MNNYEALTLAETNRRELAAKIRDLTDNPRVIRLVQQSITQLMSPPEHYMHHDHVCIYHDPHKLFLRNT